MDTSKADASVKSSEARWRWRERVRESRCVFESIHEGGGEQKVSGRGGHLSRRTMIKGNRGSRRVGANKT